jgi:CubicO group peptidase (beta-lactamase class C family)
MNGFIFVVLTVFVAFAEKVECTSRSQYHPPFTSADLQQSNDAVDVYVPWYFNSGSEQVWYGDHLWWENYVGNQNYQYNISFDYDSQYRICSNSKLFTSVSILQLVEKGVISSIYDDINLYLDETDLVSWGFPAGTTQYCPTIHGDTQTICAQNKIMSFASLLSMQSGIIAAVTCSYTSSQWQYQYCLQNEIGYSYWGSVAQGISTWIQNPLWIAPAYTYNIADPANFDSSTQNNNSYFYSNENFVLLSYFVEKLSNQSLQTYFKEHIFQPVGLNNTFYDPFSWEFLVPQNVAQEYFFYTTLPFGPSEDPSTSSGAYPPFAIGSCDSVEADPGYQAGSGGITSTLPDMVKWYSSLFINRNTSILSNSSIDLLLYPWAVTNNYPQYYGLGSELMYSSPYWSSPDMNHWTPENLSTVYYMGGSMCTFFTIVVWNDTVNPFGGPDMTTLPLVTAVARNNRILNVTKADWEAARMSGEGTWVSLTQNGDVYYQNQGWSDPTCCGDTAPSLSDTEWTAFNLAWYFGTLAFGGQPTGRPVAIPSSASSSNNDDLAPTEIRSGTIATVLLVIGLMVAFVLVGVLSYCVGKKYAHSVERFFGCGGSENNLARKENVDV